MFRTSIQDGMKFYYLCQKNSILWCIGKSVQIENTWVRATQHRIRIVRHGDSSEDIDAQFSKIWRQWWKISIRSETTITKLWRLARENWNRSSGQESKGTNRLWRRKRHLLPVERKPLFTRRSRASTFQIVSARLSKNDTRTTYTLDTSFPRHTSTSCHWWLGRCGGFRVLFFEGRHVQFPAWG